MDVQHYPRACDTIVNKICSTTVFKNRKFKSAFVGAENNMPILKQAMSHNNGIFIYEKGKTLFIKQLNAIEIATLYQAILANIKNIHTTFGNPLETSE